jgi:hypothetical protein
MGRRWVRSNLFIRLVRSDGVPTCWKLMERGLVTTALSELLPYALSMFSVPSHITASNTSNYIAWRMGRDSIPWVRAGAQRRPAQSILPQEPARLPKKVSTSIGPSRLHGKQRLLGLSSSTAASRVIRCGVN